MPIAVDSISLRRYWEHISIPQKIPCTSPQPIPSLQRQPLLGYFCTIDQLYGTAVILNSWTADRCSCSGCLFSHSWAPGLWRHRKKFLASVGDTHPRFCQPSNFLSLQVTDEVMVENNIGLQVDDLLPDGLQQQVGTGIGLVGAVEARDLVVSRLEGQAGVGIRGKGLGAGTNLGELHIKQWTVGDPECGHWCCPSECCCFFLN